MTLVEFALMSPLFLATVLGVMDGGMLMLTTNAANQSTGVGMITMSEEPQAASSDTDTIAAIKNAGLGVNALAQFDEIDFCKLQFDGTDHLVSTGQCDKWVPSGGSWSETSSGYPASTRQASAAGGAALDYVGIYVNYHYNYFARDNGAVRINLTATKLFRLEPQG